ncbi:hypothetical protein H920_07159 [Fukomys damarensis]|uniref:Retroelement silencing factor 1 n=1 Tax=Fukomys damarensis TaxID=885580 RepID=A0A091DLR0_FUKDA|nr:hypothetical protein H920_07159 [Fukomys damarensis]
MSWNTQPQRASLPPQYRKIQPAFPPQYAANQLSTSQSSFSCLSSNQEACMYLSNSNTVSQPLPNVRNYNIPLQIPASNLPNRSVVASQTIERTVYANAKGPMKANQNLQVPSGVTQNLRWKSLMMNSTPSHMEATTSRHSHFGTNPANSHALQSQRVAPDTYSVQLQVMQDSPRVPVALQGSQGSNQSLSNQQVDWAQQRASDELPYPDHRPLPKQHFYSAQSFLQDPSVHNKILMSSAPSQITHNQLPASVQSNQSAAILYQYTLQASTKPPPPPPYDCRYGNQPLQGAQHVTKHLSVDVLQGPQIHSSEVKKDFFPGFQPQWQSTNENVVPFGNSCDVKTDASVKQPFMEPARSVDGVQTLSQNNQEKKMDSYNPPSNQGTDPAVTKEKLARDIKSLMEIKKKFSELARKIKINKDLLMAAGCKPNNSLSSEPAQHPEFSKEIPAKGHCPAELVKTCLNLWKNQPSKVTEEKPSKSGEEKHANESTHISAGISKPLEFPIQNPCSAERNPQNKMENALQEAALSMLVQNYEPSCANVTKGTELQIAVVSPLILSNVIKEITPEALPETMYPVIKEGSICSLQNQLAENAAVTAALKVDVSKPVMGSMTSARVFPLIQKEKQNDTNNGDSQNTPGIHKEQCCQLNGPQPLSKPKDRILVAGDLLQIEDICSLVEGDVSYNSKIAEMFNSSLENVEPQKLSLPNEQAISTGHQEEQVGQATESKDLGLQNNEYTRCPDFPCEIAPVREEPPKLVGSSSEPVEPGILEESDLGKTTKNEGIAKNSHYSPPAVLQQDFNSGDINTSGDDAVQGPAASELHDDNTSVLYIHDQLSELLKEFPYGIEGLNECKSFASQKKLEQIPEDQTGGKISCDPKEPTDQIKITILSSEQMKELFPEQDESSGDRLPPPKLDKLAETQKKKHVAEVGSQCDPRTQEEGESPDSVVDTDNIHCCALGWLAMIYEGVPKCRCNAVEGKREEQLVPVESSSCKQRPEQGPQTSGADLTIVKLDSVSNNPKTPVTDEKTHLPKIHGNNTKDSSKTRKDDTKRRRQELPGEVPPKWKSSDKKDTSKMKQGASANMGQELTGQFSSKRNEPDPLQRNKKLKLKFHEVKFQSSDKITFSDPVSQEGPEKKCTPQNSCQLNPKTGLLPNKGLKRENNSFVQSSSQEKKKLKFKESPQERHLEKRKIDQGERLDLEIKKKKCSEQEQSKNAGVTIKLCNILPNPNEKAITKENLTSKAKSLEVNDARGTATVKEKTASQTKSTDSKDINETTSLKDKAASLAKSSGTKDGSCKVKKVITLQEYFQRKKQKEITKTAKKTCLENVLGNSAPSGSVQLSAQAESCRKSNGKGDSGIETLKDASKVNTNPGKNLKAHPPEESKACNLSRSVEGRADAKQLIKTKLDKTLSSVSSEVSSQGKEQRKSYLNRLSFRCTERESICLTTLSSSLAKLGKDKKSQEQKPKASLPGKDSTVKPGMLEFKLCPDVMLKNTNSVEDKYDLRAHPEAQAATQGVNSRLLQRSASADGREVQQNQVKDSRAMFQTYKQLYLQKRGRSLGSSPVQ